MSRKQITHRYLFVCVGWNRICRLKEKNLTFNIKHSCYKKKIKILIRVLFKNIVINKSYLHITLSFKSIYLSLL